MRRKEAIALYAMMGALAWLLTASSVALAGTYEVSACNDAPGALNNSWAWSTTDLSQPAHYAEHAECPDRVGGTGGTSDQEGGLSTTDALGLSDGAPPGTSAGWNFTAPQGTTITALDYERYIGHIFDSNNYWSPALRADGTPITGESCLDTIANGETCFVGGPPDEGGEPSILTGLAAHELALNILCEAPAEQECITGATKYKAWAAMYGARVTLSDPTPPTLNTPTGPLWEPGTSDGFHKGTETVTASAQDIGGGVQRILLSADGQPLQTYEAPCDFTFAQPCPLTTGTHIFTLPTTSLTDGTHTLTLTAIDAADNQSTIATTQITVDNNPPAPPTELTAAPTQTGSSTFIATWTNPPGQVAPIAAATYQVCPTSTPEACSAPADAPAEGPLTLSVPGPGTWRLAVWLTDAAGNTSPSNEAYTTLIVPTSEAGTGKPGIGDPSSSGLSGSPAGGNPSPEGSGSKGTQTSRPTIHLSEALHGRTLIVHVSGPTTGKVRVSYTGHYRNITISKAKTVTLKNGQLTTTFKLNARTAAHATIQVSAQLNHQVAMSTLHHQISRPAHKSQQTKKERSEDLISASQRLRQPL